MPLEVVYIEQLYSCKGVPGSKIVQLKVDESSFESILV